MKAPLIHVAHMVFGTPLAIMPEKLEAILRAVGPRLMVDSGPRLIVDSEGGLTERVAPLGLDLQQPIMPGNVTVGTLNTGTLAALASSAPLVPAQPVVLRMQADDEEQKEKPYRLTPEGIAVVPIRGTLMKRNSWISAASGCSSYGDVQKAAAAALADPMCKALLLDVDSPGGTTHGCFECCDALYGMRGDKPIWALANDLAASAAYALASAADRVFVTRTGGVGSVGVFALHYDQSGADAAAGVKFTYIHAGDKKIDGNPHEPLSKSAKMDIQDEVDREYDMFVSAVARNRGFAGASMKKIQATEAGVYFAENALPLLADEVATYDEALQALTSKVTGTGAKLAPETIVGNNALDTADSQTAATPDGEAEGVDAMAKTDEQKRADAENKQAALAAAAPDDGDDDDEDDKKKDDEDEPEAKKGNKSEEGKCGTVTTLPVAADSPARQIAELCHIAGSPELAADYIMKGYSVDKVIAKLSARRSKASADAGAGVSSYVTGQGSSPEASVDAAVEQARTLSANSGGTLSMSRAMERILRSNPAIYNNYLEERGAVAAQVAFTGGGRALNEYVLNHQRRYMTSLGLSSVIDDVPGRRAM